MLILRVGELYSFALKNYLSQERCIDPDLAKLYVKEVHYQTLKTGQKFFALGFPSGTTFALRNKLFKGFAGTGADLSIFEKHSSSVLLFEGFIDFLSYLSAKRINQPDKTAIVMNSSAMLGRVVNYVKKSPKIKEIEYFRDRDELNSGTTGTQSFQQLQAQILPVVVVDRSNAYLNHKDLNEWRQQVCRKKIPIR